MGPSPHCSAMFDFSTCNETELYQVCRRVGLPVTPRTSKEEMVSYLLGEKEPPDVENIFDGWRDGIMRFLLDHWSVVESQLSCPAKSGDPRSCYQCVDAQVVSCVVQQNPYDQRLIELRRK
jgi:hypothetical protein